MSRISRRFCGLHYGWASQNLMPLHTASFWFSQMYTAETPAVVGAVANTRTSPIPTALPRREIVRESHFHHENGHLSSTL